ncbi:DeoR/GlpR family DNA-binding transcription regulator [Paenibacillus thermotolerans]|uniref:DeoR/GlpR family DNA-binding transcription regulator n=1 Tax=Paenibacillus thermotolerans TaxID=3027807 RepID=UPI002368CE4D|nr:MULTISPECIES: DeoR/GlpR family DNA-binding transcription regulator [unclassified Paenibacillus]
MRGKVSKGDERRRRIMDIIKEKGAVSIAEIMERFGCSEVTARRDLNILAETESIIRTIGGAHYETQTGHEASFSDKERLLWDEKTKIAEKAASLVEEGDIVGLTGGTTTFLIARALKAASNITVVTNAVNIAMELAGSDRIQTVLTGGVMRVNSFELCGPLAETIVERLHIGKMFVGIDGFSIEQGLTTYSELEAGIDKLMIKRAKETYAVFDHTKVNKSSLFTIVPIADITGCITDRPLGEPVEAHLRGFGKAIHYAWA